jgi:Fe-S-cluster containining protein
MSGPPGNPCVSCGACCATYRVSFYWAEAERRGLESALVEQVNPWMACMAGTQGPAPRCGALEGRVGEAATCRVYAQRPEPCRELQAGDDKCRRARERHGLPALAAPTLPLGA